MKFRFLTIFLSVSLLFGVAGAAGYAVLAAEGGTTYYISNSDGNDGNSGTAEGEAWESFANLKTKVLGPGDKVLLKRGDVWSDRLEIMAEGSEQAYAEVGAYGDEALEKPTIRQSGGADDIAVLVKDFYYDGSKVVTSNIRYLKIHDLNIEDTRMGIFVRTYARNNDGQNMHVEISDCTFNNIDAPEIMEELNKYVEEVEAANPQPSPDYPEDELAFDVNIQTTIANQISNKIAELLNEPKGNLPVVQNGTYSETGGGAGEYIFPAAVFVGGRKDPIMAEKPDTVASAKPAMQYFTVEDCVMSECVAGVMSWFYGYNNTTGSNAWRETLKNVRIQDVTITGAINGGLAMECVDGGAELNAAGDGMQPSTDGWGEIRNFRVLSGSDEPYHTFPNGTTGAIFESSKNFLITECEFSGMTNQGNADGCGFDFESNCENIELSDSAMQNNEGGAILIMDNGHGSHKNLFIRDNLMYSNLQHAFAAGNNRNNNIEVAYVHIYNAGNRNVCLENNVILMQQSIRPGSNNAKYNIHAVGPKPATEADGTVNYIWTGNTEEFYEGGNRVAYDTYYEGQLNSEGKIVLETAWLHSKVYRAMRLEVKGSTEVSGTIWGESIGGEKTSESPVSFSTEDGYVNIGALDGITWEKPNERIEISIAGGKAGDEYTLEFVPDTQVVVEKLTENEYAVELQGESKAAFADDVTAEMFVLQGKLSKREIVNAEKTGLYRIKITMDGPADEGYAGITVLPEAYVTYFEEIFSGCGPDGAINEESWYYPQVLKVERLPEKLNYEQGEALDIMGLKLTMRTAAGEAESISAGLCTVEGYDPQKAGRQTVTVRYKNGYTTFDVQVMESGGSADDGGGCGGAITGYAGIAAAVVVFGALLLLCRVHKKN